MSENVTPPPGLPRRLDTNGCYLVLPGASNSDYPVARINEQDAFDNYVIAAEIARRYNAAPELLSFVERAAKDDCHAVLLEVCQRRSPEARCPACRAKKLLAALDSARGA